MSEEWTLPELPAKIEPRVPGRSPKEVPNRFPVEFLKILIPELSALNLVPCLNNNNVNYTVHQGYLLKKIL